MPNWDEDSPKLRENLGRVLKEIARSAEHRETPTLDAAKRWQKLLMEDLDMGTPRFACAFRGEQGLKDVQVRVGANYGVNAARVAKELTRFEQKLQTIVVQMDVLLPNRQEPDADQVAAVVDLCAWAHAEWVRIHPFANGNGRTARLWANSLAMRYGLPPYIRLRPRPDNGYAAAGAKAMQGDWKPTAVVFRRLLSDFLDEF
ncbi:MAG TPA: Fic family protein [Candidatus Angelobacter sp.]|nr:Fic family protein [Candidatus Angelobacter sp.]